MNELFKQEIVFEEDKCYVETPISPDFVRRELVMTKEVFIECYNRWIKENIDKYKIEIEPQKRNDKE